MVIPMSSSKRDRPRHHNPQSQFIYSYCPYIQTGVSIMMYSSLHYWYWSDASAWRDYQSKHTNRFGTSQKIDWYSPNENNRVEMTEKRGKRKIVSRLQ
jgi:hypothetical protein